MIPSKGMSSGTSTSVCNSAESLLVHEAIAGEFVPRITKVLQDAGVLVHGDPTFADQEGVLPASEAGLAPLLEGR